MSFLRRAAGRVRRALRPAPAPAAAAPAAAAPAPPSWATTAPSPWAPGGTANVHECNICRWTGDAFATGFHAEGATCPQCGSIARDRFLFHCYVRRSPEAKGARVLETSPRLGDDYRAAMARWFDYLCSDYDESAHKGTVRLDLQAIDRPDASFDVVLTPHVLEHVPDTAAALSELFRVLAPGGRVYLQVPVLQGVTAPPTTPEFHGDNTPVFWRFGFDLTATLREQGFTTSLLCTEEWLDTVKAGTTEWPTGTSPEFDVTSMLAGVIPADLVPVADPATAQRYGFVPGYMFLTWECIKP